MGRPTYRNGPRPSLTDADLLAIGAVVSQWSLGEHCLAWALESLLRHPSVAPAKPATKRPLGLKNKLVIWRKAVRLACANHPDHLELGLFLSDRGRELSARRNRLAHWMIGRASMADPAMTAMSFESGTPKIAAFTADQLLELAYDIGAWYGAVNSFRLAILCDLPSTAHVEWHGSRLSNPLAPVKQYRDDWEVLQGLSKL